MDLLSGLDTKTCWAVGACLQRCSLNRGLCLVYEERDGGVIDMLDGAFFGRKCCVS